MTGGSMQSLRSVLSCGLVAGLTGATVLLPGASAEAATTAQRAGVKVPYTCNAAIGTVSAPITVGGKTPATGKSGAAVSMSGFEIHVHVSAAEVNKVIAITHANSASGTVTKLAIHSTDAKPATVNAAAKPIAFGPIALVKNKAITIAVPHSPETIGKWVAQSTGTMTFTSGAVDLKIKVGSFTVVATCKPTKAVTVSTTQVS